MRKKWKKTYEIFSEMNKKYQIFWIHPKEGAELKELSVVFDIPEICTVEDCIMLGLKELNKILELKQKGYCLAENPKLYELFIAKKTGRPKEDYPCKFYWIRLFLNCFFFGVSL